MKLVFKHQDLQFFCLIFSKYEYFYALEIVGRGSKTQFQVGQNRILRCSDLRVNRFYHLLLNNLIQNLLTYIICDVAV